VQQVFVHAHRADLPKGERDRAQHALAQDFMKAGLFDRAEQAYRALDGTAYDTESRLALLTLLERSREWRAAVEIGHKLERSGTGSFASRISHYWCELAHEADARHQTAAADAAVESARQAAPEAARPLVLAGQRAAARGDHAQALQLWGSLMNAHPAAFSLVARDHAASALACGEGLVALDRLRALYQRAPSMDLLAAIATLDPAAEHQRERLAAHLRDQPSLSAAHALLVHLGGSALRDAEAGSLRDALGRAARPLQRYRCAACGFEAQHYFWQCPGCLGWDTYPPQRLEDL
jgi:lipopolysaccharide assembly protein B